MPKDPFKVANVAISGGGGGSRNKTNSQKDCQDSGFVCAIIRFFWSLLKNRFQIKFQRQYCKPCYPASDKSWKAIFLQKFSTFLAQKFFVISSLLSTVVPTLISILLSVVSYCCLLTFFSKKKFQQTNQLHTFISSSLKKVLHIRLFGCKFFLSNALSLLSRGVTPRLRNSNCGAILLLLALFVPIVLVGMKYSQTYISKKVPPLEEIDVTKLYKECAREAALAVAKVWNPAKTLSDPDQEKTAYDAANAVYNAHPCFQKSRLGAALPGLSEGGTSLSPSLLQSTYPDPDKTHVQITVENDRIKVTTDDQSAYALPAECDLDIVFAIPVNSGVSSTTLSQISQACQKFVSEHFYHTRGVYMSLIPYSGKLSIPDDTPSETRYKDWTALSPKANISGTKMTLSDLYATNGSKDGSLGQTEYSWTGVARPIMHRKNNNLFSNDEPNDNDKRYLRMNLHPCYASPQSTICEKACISYAANPNYIVEPVINMESFGDNLARLSIDSTDGHNKSNFIFMALEWANNMFQSWTAGSTAVGASSNNLSYPAKGKKKAIILIVNKAENFEPAELTYLGFKNDASQVLRQSDVIDFSKQHGDTSLTFADGTPYLHVMGAKQLLHFVSANNSIQRDTTSGYYQTTGTCSCYLQIPKKHFIKLVVEPVSIDPTFEIKTCDFKTKIQDFYNYGTLGVGPIGTSQFMLGHTYWGRLGYSTNGENWTEISSGAMPKNALCAPLIYGNGIWVSAVHSSANNLYYAPNLHTGTQANVFTVTTNTDLETSKTLNFGNGTFMLLSNKLDSAGNCKNYTSKNGITWTLSGTCKVYSTALAYGNGMWLRSGAYGSTDDGKNWAYLGAKNFAGLTFGRGFFFSSEGNCNVSRSKDGRTWTTIPCSACSESSSHGCITYFNDKLYIIGGIGKCCHIGTFPESYIKFTNLGTGAVTNNKTYNLKGRQEFYIESSQISNTKVGDKYQVKFDVKNVRFISAEMTDKAYTKTEVECSILGTESAPYIETNAKRELSVKVKTEVTTRELMETITKETVTVPVDGASATINGIGYTFTDTNDHVFSWPKFTGNQNSETTSWSCTLNHARIISATLEKQTFSQREQFQRMEHWDMRITPGFERWIAAPVTNGTFSAEIIAIEFPVNISFFGTTVSHYVSTDTPHMDLANRANNDFRIVCNSSIYKDSNGNSATNGTSFSCIFDKNAKQNFKMVASSTGGTVRFVKPKLVNNDAVTYGVSSDANSIYLSGNNLCFRGGGEKLTVTVRPDTTTKEVEHTTKVPYDNKQVYTDTMLIDPVRYDYQKQSDGKYRIYLPLKKSQLSDPRLTDTSPIFTFIDSVAPNIGSANTVLLNCKDGGATLEEITEDACTKLNELNKEITTEGKVEEVEGKEEGSEIKEVESSNFRLYLIEYDKNETDYGYLEKFAGTDRTYKASDKDTFNTVLKKVAENLKEWAGYEAAKSWRGD